MRETIKTIVIFILCGTTVVLLANLWWLPIEQNAIIADNDATLSISDVSYLIDINTVNYNFDDGRIVTFFYDKFKTFQIYKSQIALALLKVNEAEPIEKAVYDTNRTAASIEFNFKDDFDARSFITIINSQAIPFEPRLSSIKSILLSNLDTKALFVSDGQNYYKISTSSFDWNIQNTLAQIEPSASVPYTSIVNRLSIQGDKKWPAHDVLIPTGRIDQFDPIICANETIPNESTQVNILASKVFGSRLGFVQRVTDVNDAVVMIYGYGEQALKITPDGRMEYSKKIDKDHVKSADLIDDITAAVARIAWLNFDISELYLSSVKTIKVDGITGFNFQFGYRLNDYRILNNQYPAGVVVDVVGGQVKLIKRNVKHYSQIAKQFTTPSNDPFYTIINNEINFNQHFMADYYSETPELAKQTNAYIDVIANIDGFSIAYLDEGTQYLTPVYIISLGKYNYYFDLTTYQFRYKGENQKWIGQE